MRAIIHYNNGIYEDEIHLSANSIEELKEKAFKECDKRDWKYENCWSEVEE